MIEKLQHYKWRIVLTVAICFFVLTAPWYVALAFAAFGVFRYTFFVEAAVCALFYDALYSPSPIFRVGLFGISLACIAVIEILRNQLRDKDTKTLRS